MPPNLDNPTPPAPNQPGQAPEASLPRSKWRLASDLFSTIGVFVLSIAIAFCLIAFVFQSYQVDGPSMQNTLHNQDRLIVWKLPRTWARLTGHQYVPNRGDIIIFVQTGLAAYGQTNTKQLIKRVIGLPGDRVVVMNGTLTIYNGANPSGFQPDKTLAYQNEITQATAGNLDLTLKDDQVFVCGDNRDNSLDSRYFGPISTSQIVGKLAMRILPINQAETF